MPKCRICSIKYIPRFFLQKTCEDVKCIIEYSKIQREKKEQKEWSEKKKIARIELYPKKSKAYLQDEINKLSRMIDARFGYLCIDCNKPYGKQIDACHFHNKSTHGEITYNLHNLHSGRSDCNFYSSEHKTGYYEGLISRYGKEYADYVKEGLQKPKNGKIMTNEIPDKLKIVRDLIRNYDTFIFKDGKEGREIFNKIINIYN